MSSKPNPVDVDEEDDHWLVCRVCEMFESFETYAEYHEHHRQDHIENR